MKWILLACILVASISVWGQETISRVHFFPQNKDQLSKLYERGFTPEHLIPIDKGEWAGMLEARDLTLLDQMTIPYSIEIADVEAHYARMLKNQQPLLDSRSFCGLTHFQAGTMGAYHTYAETISQLDSMRSLFPDLISAKFPIGSSHEGRTIYGVKISDHPEIDESSTEAVVYLDALTHAREPLSLEVSLYYMWWLLENYGQVDIATYLVDNREIYVVPVVNPDGYVYNQQIQPNGGGMWRKNRRQNSNGCYGIDLNRNFSLGWGAIIGSTSDPCSNTYRGTKAFSEPETQAVRNLLDSISPKIAFSIHSFGNKLLNPLGYVDSVVNYEVYAELASEFIPPKYFGYGTVKEMLNYNSAGTTRDYFHDQNIIGWTVEIGSEFWEPAINICHRVREFLRPLVYMSRVAGDFVKIQGYHQGEALPGDSVSLFFRIKNKGLSRQAEAVRLILNPLTSGLNVMRPNQIISDVPVRRFVNNSQQLFWAEISPQAQIGEELPLEVILTQDGIESDRDTVMVIAGVKSTRFADDFENGKGWWYTQGNQISWDTTFIDQWSGKTCMTDSRYGNYRFNSATYLYLQKEVDLQNSFHPILTFASKWSLEPGYDWAMLEIQTTDQNTWTALQGKYTSNNAGKAAWTGHQGWVRESIDLSAYQGKTVRFRFVLNANELVHSDGFYLDDFEIIDYRPNYATGIESANFLGSYLSVSPNPAKDKLKITAAFPQTSVYHFVLRDASGKEILSSEGYHLGAGVNEISLDVKGIPSGIYLIHVFSEAGVGWKKVILE